MAIKPIDLPAAAGIDYSGGDVRHFSQGDAVNVPGMSNPTRNLAERDNLLASKMNEVVAVVNNQEQFVPLPVIRTTIPPNEEVIVTNYRIPAGFEARVLNAVISTTPTSTSAQINVYYSTSYGGTSGVSVVTVTPGSEFTGDVNFYQTGEFIVSLKNTGSSTLELAASVMLTMRPLGAEGTLLVGSIIEGLQGKPGMRGVPGPPGIPGTGGAGSPGMVWQGAWTNGVSYFANDVVSFSLYGSITSSYICRVANTANTGVNDPQVDAVTWNAVAIGGSTGASGGAGPAGPSSFSLTGSVSSVDGTWRPSIGCVSDLMQDGQFVYSGGGVVYPNTAYVSVQETFYGSTGGSPGTFRGLSSLNGIFYLDFAGTGTVTLPKQLYGALADYSNASINCIAVAHGTTPVYFTGSGTWAAGVELRSAGQDSFVVKTRENLTMPVAVHVLGVQQIYN
jgi:hypothetical protein